ncbi:MAG: hypothetical protein KF726_09985 [Anaerolineae bacterium]|nr:hypothetical protein [Anaerolineae bacterium]
MSLNLENAELLRVFTDEGIAQFRAALQGIKEGELGDLPYGLITDPALTRVIDSRFYVEYYQFETTAQLVGYLHPIIQQLPLPAKFNNSGLWAWLSAFYFDLVCPSENGFRKPGGETRHILPTASGWRENYRHLIAAPMRMFNTYSNEEGLMNLFLYTRPHEQSEFLRHIMSVQDLAMNRGVLEALSLLYWDTKTDYPKRGALSKEPDKPGTLRRFVSILNQLNMTYDLQAMSGQQILELLPKREFGRWMT